MPGLHSCLVLLLLVIVPVSTDVQILGESSPEEFCRVTAGHHLDKNKSFGFTYLFILL